VQYSIREKDGFAEGREQSWSRATSSKIFGIPALAHGHLLLTVCRMTGRNLDLTGPFELQLQALLVSIHGKALLRIGSCAHAARLVECLLIATRAPPHAHGFILSRARRRLG
jgi:hypothetical protein